MSLPHEHLAPGEQPHEFAYRTGLSELYVLSESLAPGALRQTVRIARGQRQRALEYMRTYHPSEPPATPEYDGDPVGYIAQARAVVAAPHLLASSNLWDDIYAARRHANEYFESPGVRDRLTGIAPGVDEHRLARFFVSNFSGFVVTGRSIALHQFVMARNQVLRQRFPGIRLISAGEMMVSARTMAITGTDIEGAKQDITRVIPAYRTPYPDFLQLPAEQQAGIVAAVGNEWEELCELLQSVDPSLFIDAERDIPSMLYVSVAKLKKVIANNPSLSPARLCRSYLQNAMTFNDELTKLHIYADSARGLREAQAHAWRRPVPADAATGRPLALKEKPRSRGELDFSQLDHVRVAALGKQFYMPIERPNALLAARVLEYVARASHLEYIEGADAVNVIWAEMPEAERSLFYVRSTDKNKRGMQVIGAGVIETFRRLLSPLRMTHEKGEKRFKLDKPATVMLEMEPPTEAELVDLRYIFPVGTLRERVLAAKGDTVPPDTLAAADDVLQAHIFASEALDPETAHDLLVFITDTYGKRALRIQLEAYGGEVPLEQALRRLHGRVAWALGEGAASAHRNRMIAGNIATGQERVRQVSGRLPPRTYVTPVTIRRWYIEGITDRY